MKYRKRVNLKSPRFLYVLKNCNQVQNDIETNLISDGFNLMMSSDPSLVDCNQEANNVTYL